MTVMVTQRKIYRLTINLCVCVCVCVRVRERELLCRNENEILNDFVCACVCEGVCVCV